MPSSLVLRRAGLGALSGFLVGLLAGVIARIDMRLIAVAAGLNPVFTVASLNPIVMGEVVGAGFGMIFIYLESRLPGRRWLKGLLFGTLLFVVLLLPLYLWQPELRAELALAPGNLGLALFGILPFVFGLFTGLAVELLDHRLPAMLAPDSPARTAFIALFLAGLVGLGFIVFGLIDAFVMAER